MNKSDKISVVLKQRQAQLFRRRVKELDLPLSYVLRSFVLDFLNQEESDKLSRINKVV